ncbi:MAG: methyltransferase domain-containing protein [Aeromonadales bacterium]|nr:methyltransferase domain-containing protein [Aeromonadales bacterium]MDY2891067.1 methyltransferase domain-containing protein [Succinivibrio sp.]
MLDSKSMRARRFSRAAVTYDQGAAVQAEAARTLFEMLKERLSGNCSDMRILEAGCGTGTLSKMLLELAPARLELFDISEGMLEQCRKRLENNPAIRLAVADCERDPLPGGFDLVASSSAMQWFEDLRRGFVNLRTALKPHGLMGIFVFTEGTFEEIREVSGDGISYRTAAEVEEIARGLLDDVQVRKLERTTHYKDPVSMLKSLRGCGVSGTGGRAWTRGRLKAFSEEYARRFSDEDGVRLSWRGIFVTGRAP